MKKIVWKKKYKKLVLALLALLVVIAAAGYTVFIAPNLETEEWVYKEMQVQKGELAVGVTESGTLEYVPTSQIYDLELSTGDSSEDEEEDEEEKTYRYLEVESVQAAVGQRLKEGDVILTFTQKSVEGVRKLLKNQVSEAQVALAEAKSEYNLEILDVEQTYKKRLIEAKGAEGKLNAALTEPAREIQDYELQITLLYEEIIGFNEQWETVEETREKSCEEYNELHEKIKDMTDNVEYAKIHDDYLRAKENYESAVERQASIKEQIADSYEQIADYEKKITDTNEKTAINNLEGQQTYDSTVIAGELAESVRETELEKLMTEVESAEDELLKCENRFQEFETFVGDGKVYAAADGIVTEIGYEEGDDLINEGTIVSYTTAEDMQISVDVSQEDIVDLSVGDGVDIVFSAYEDEVYEGEIASIMTTSTSEYAATVSYEVVIEVQGDTSKLYGGMTADVTFVTEKKENVVYVSRTAVEEENGKNFVYVKDNKGEMITKEVITGIENTIYVEIVEGLEEGEVVYAASKVSKNKDKEEDKEDDSNLGNNMEGMDFEMPEGMKFEMPEGMNFQMPEGMPPQMGGGRPQGGGRPNAN